MEKYQHTQKKIYMYIKNYKQKENNKEQNIKERQRKRQVIKMLNIKKK